MYSAPPTGETQVWNPGPGDAQVWHPPVSCLDDASVVISVSFTCPLIPHHTAFNSLNWYPGIRKYSMTTDLGRLKYGISQAGLNIRETQVWNPWPDMVTLNPFRATIKVLWVGCVIGSTAGETQVWTPRTWWCSSMASPRFLLMFCQQETLTRGFLIWLSNDYIPD